MDVWHGDMVQADPHVKALRISIESIEPDPQRQREQGAQVGVVDLAAAEIGRIHAEERSGPQLRRQDAGQGIAVDQLCAEAVAVIVVRMSFVVMHEVDPELVVAGSKGRDADSGSIEFLAETQLEGLPFHVLVAARVSSMRPPIAEHA
jgi:hypothetical protein